ncbi:MAG: shikimate kinase AroK [Cellvibrionaceae bacterium]
MSKLNIVLVGPMGVGKTTIGRQLSRELQLPFFDSDRVIEERTGADIPWIFDMEGEDGFRKRESGVLTELLEQDGLVIATGGGIVTRSENRNLLNQGGVVVYLTASVDQLCKRTSKDKKRPLLQVEDPRQKIEELLAERDPLYKDVADVIVDTERKGVRGVIKEIVDCYKQASSRI